MDLHRIPAYFIPSTDHLNTPLPRDWPTTTPPYRAQDHISKQQFRLYYANSPHKVLPPYMRSNRIVADIRLKGYSTSF